MDFELKTLTRARLSTEKCDALVVLVPQDMATADSADPVSKLLALAIKSGDLETKPGKLLHSYRAAGITATRLVLVGCGDGSAKNVRLAVLAAINALKSSNVTHLVLSLCALEALSNDVLCRAVVACGDAAYAYATTKSKPVAAKLVQVSLAVPNAAKFKPGFDKGLALVKGLALAKEWANRPANYATPVMLAGAAKALGKLPAIKVDVLGLKEVAKLGMGAFMAVAQGSVEPLRFIVLRYDGAAKTQAPIVLVGKGISFDTGGISIKPAADMDEMKFDMCGAASVLGTFRALAGIQPKINVVGLIPACENMPSGKAVKPGDVVTSMSGQTIENLNTDAEGRLVLCDALTYAERFKPAAVIDIATLTGACVIALGAVRSGLFSANDDLANALLKAGESSGDPCWRMPLDDEYGEGLKSNFADMANVAGRAAGSVTAAKFLQKFTASYPWAHLDIAGTAWKSGAVKGSTGRPVLLLLNYLLNLESNQALTAVSIDKTAIKKVVKKVLNRPAKTAVKA